MKNKNIRSQSRRKTPWDDLNEEERTPLQSFLRSLYIGSYEYHHQSLSAMNDSAVLDKYLPSCCPYCGSVKYVRNGHYKSTGLQRYICCECHQSFCITTGTIFEDHKLSIGEWMQYLLNLFDYVSLNAGSKNNRNTFTTSRYWLQKVFLVLESYQDNIVLRGKIYLDETYWTERKGDLIKAEDGKLLRGISRNQICIASAADRTRIFCRVEGNGKPSSEGILQVFSGHIQKGSKLIHDGEAARNDLVNHLHLKEEVYLTEETSGLDDAENPLNRINHVHALLAWFLGSHSSFMRENLNGYLNLFALIMNPPHNKLEKVELFLKMAINTHVSLKYRDFYKKPSDEEES